ncbi:MAG: class I SAM-dependent methyltransferase [Egibacteraceae bacterium]
MLELGFAHGVSTCYLAAAVAANGGGSVLTFDNRTALVRSPSIAELLDHLELEAFVTPVFAERSYTWELMKLIEIHTRAGMCRPAFDFCFIDGAHSWEVDGFAFFLVEKLLLPGSWMLFDDLDWTFATSPALGHTAMVRSMPIAERVTPQIGRVFDLLVRQHSNVDEFRMDGSWGWAHKRQHHEIREEV